MSNKELAIVITLVVVTLVHIIFKEYRYAPIDTTNPADNSYCYYNYTMSSGGDLVE